jgi:DNA-binding LacI/PurR family transcriptional regulator
MGMQSSANADEQVFTLAGNTHEEIAHRIVDGGYTAALFFANPSSLRMFHALKNTGNIRIPETFSFVALEVPGINEDMSPAVTSIVQPVQEIAQAAIDGVIQLIEGKKPRPREVFKSALVQRGSTARVG